MFFFIVPASPETVRVSWNAVFIVGIVAKLDPRKYRGGYRMAGWVLTRLSPAQKLNLSS